MAALHEAQCVCKRVRESCITGDGAVEDADDAKGVAVVVHGAEVAARPDLQHIGDAG